MIDEDAVRALLRTKIDAGYGGLDKAASNLQLSEDYLVMMLNGRRSPSKRILQALGLRRVVSYEPAKD